MFIYRSKKISQQNQIKWNIKWNCSKPKSDAKIRKSISSQKYLPKPPQLDTITEENVITRFKASIKIEQHPQSELGKDSSLLPSKHFIICIRDWLGYPFSKLQSTHAHWEPQITINLPLADPKRNSSSSFHSHKHRGLQKNTLHAHS